MKTDPRIRLVPAMCVVLLCTLLGSCDSDEILDPERSGDALARVVTPGNIGVAGAMVTLIGVDDVILADGDVIIRQSGEGIRVILLLEEAGVLDFGVRMTPGATQITGTIDQVIGPDDLMVESLGGYSLEFER